MKKTPDLGRMERARDTARVFLTGFVRDGYFAPLELSPGSLAHGAWKVGNLRGLVDKARKGDLVAWAECEMALMYGDATAPGFNDVRELGFRAMRGEVKRPPQKRKHAVRDGLIVLAVDLVATQTGLRPTRSEKKDGVPTSACDAVADVLNELGQHHSNGKSFSYETIEQARKRLLIRASTPVK